MEKYFAAVEPFSFPSRFIALERSAAQRLQELHADFMETKQEPASFPPELEALAEKISAVCDAFLHAEC
jgi:hypothetical protein